MNYTLVAILLGLLLYLIVRPITWTVLQNSNLPEDVQGVIYVQGSPIYILSPYDPFLTASPRDILTFGTTTSSPPTLNDYYDVLVQPFSRIVKTPGDRQVVDTSAQNDVITSLFTKEEFENEARHNMYISRQTGEKTGQFLKDSYGKPMVHSNADVSITRDESHNYRKYRHDFDTNSQRFVRTKETQPLLVPIGQKANPFEQSIHNCLMRKEPTGMAIDQCGYCVDDKKYHYYLDSDTTQPAVDATKPENVRPSCNAQRFITDESAVVELLAREHCKSISNCSQIYVGDGNDKCKFVKSLGYAIPVNENGQPRFGDDIDENDMIHTKEQCKAYNDYRNHPCNTSNYETGPHTPACLTALWAEVGCSAEGTAAPALNEELSQQWNQMGVEQIRQSMNQYKMGEEEGTPQERRDYMMKCSGITAKPCDIMNDDGTPTRQCYTDIFMEQGCQPKGSLYPSGQGVDYEDLKRIYPNKELWTQYVYQLQALTVNNKNKHAHNIALGKCINSELGYVSPYSCNPNGVEVYAFTAHRMGNDFIRGAYLCKAVSNGFHTNYGERRFSRAGTNILHYYAYLDIKETGHYDFRVTFRDGVRVFINGEKLVDNWNDRIIQRSQTFGTRLDREEKNVMFIEFLTNDRYPVLELSWIKPGVKRKITKRGYLVGPFQNIPDSVFRRQDYAEEKPTYQFDIGHSFSPYNIPGGYLNGISRGVRQFQDDSVPYGRFDGRTDHIELGPFLHLGTRTIVFYAKMSDLKGNYFAKIMQCVNAKSERDVDYLTISTGIGNGDLLIHNTEFSGCYVSDFFDEDQWTHCGIVFRDNEIAVYKNGRAANVIATTPLIQDGTTTSQRPFHKNYIGRGVNEYTEAEALANNPNSRSSTSSHMKGYISYIHMYDKEMSGEEVAYDYKRVTTFDSAQCRKMSSYCGIDEADKAICKMFYKSGLAIREDDYALNEKDTGADNTDIFNTADYRQDFRLAKSATGKHYAKLDYNDCNPFA